MNFQQLQAFLWHHLDWATEISMSQHLIAGEFFIKASKLWVALLYFPWPNPSWHFLMGLRVAQLFRQGVC